MVCCSPQLTGAPLYSSLFPHLCRWWFSECLTLTVITSCSAMRGLPGTQIQALENSSFPFFTLYNSFSFWSKLPGRRQSFIRCCCGPFGIILRVEWTSFLHLETVRRLSSLVVSGWLVSICYCTCWRCQYILSPGWLCTKSSPVTAWEV